MQRQNWFQVSHKLLSQLAIWDRKAQMFQFSCIFDTRTSFFPLSISTLNVTNPLPEAVHNSCAVVGLLIEITDGNFKLHEKQKQQIEGYQILKINK